MSTSKYEAHGVIDPDTKSPSDEDKVKIDDYSGHPVRGQEPECDPYWCPCPVCQNRMRAQRLPELSDTAKQAPTAWVWNYDSLADEVHVSFSLDGVRHKIEHDVARCDCAAGVPKADAKSPSDTARRGQGLQVIREDFDYYQQLRARSYARSWMADRLHDHIGILLNMLEDK